MAAFAVSVTEFKAHCLDVIRQVEQGGATVDLTQHGKVVARLAPYRQRRLLVVYRIARLVSLPADKLAMSFAMANNKLSVLGA